MVAGMITIGVIGIVLEHVSRGSPDPERAWGTERSEHVLVLRRGGFRLRNNK